MSDNRIKEIIIFMVKHSANVMDRKIKRYSFKQRVPGFEVEITNLEAKVTTVYSTIRKAASAMDSDIKTILRREKLQNEKGINTPYRKKYIITINRD